MNSNKQVPITAEMARQLTKEANDISGEIKRIEDSILLEAEKGRSFLTYMTYDLSWREVEEIKEVFRRRGFTCSSSDEILMLTLDWSS